VKPGYALSFQIPYPQLIVLPNITYSFNPNIQFPSIPFSFANDFNPVVQETCTIIIDFLYYLRVVCICILTLMSILSLIIFLWHLFKIKWRSSLIICKAFKNSLFWFFFSGTWLPFLLALLMFLLSYLIQVQITETSNNYYSFANGVDQKIINFQILIHNSIQNITNESNGYVSLAINDLNNLSLEYCQTSLNLAYNDIVNAFNVANTAIQQVPGLNSILYLNPIWFNAFTGFCPTIPILQPFTFLLDLQKPIQFGPFLLNTWLTPIVSNMISFATNCQQFIMWIGIILILQSFGCIIVFIKTLLSVRNQKQHLPYSNRDSINI
jgi:hypothetical protein